MSHTLVIQTNASQATDVTVGDMGVIIPNSGGTETFTDYQDLVKGAKSLDLRTLATDDAFGAGSSTLILTDGTNTVDQANVSSFLTNVAMGSPGRTVAVAKESLPDGTYITTIAAGIVEATALTPTSGSPVSIVVYPGVYTEAPLTLPAFVNLTSVGGAEVTEIAASSTTSPLLTAPAGIRVSGLKFSGANGAGGVGVQFGTSGLRARIDACLITDCTVGLLATGSGVQVFADAVVILRRSGEVAGEAFKAAAAANLFCFSCRANGESGVLLASGYVATGSGSVITCDGGQAVFCTNGMQATLSGQVIGTAIRFEGCTQSRRLGPGASGDMLTQGCNGLGVTWDLLIDGATSTLELGGDEINQNNVSFLTDTTFHGFAVDHVSTGKQALIALDELHSGFAESGSRTAFGEGAPYTRGMVVITTDSTASPSVDGGNLTDVSTDAASSSGSTFTFQGVTNGFAILFGSSLTTGTVLKHWGLLLAQTTAAVEVTPKSFIYEIWDGANWVEIGAMTIHSTLSHRYGNEHFIRTNTTESIRYGIDISTTWATKLISGSTLFWSRIRIATTITTAPVFEQAHLSPSRFESNIDGTNNYHGLSRFRTTLLGVGNVFGESGTVVDQNPAVGSGGLPTGWSHAVKNSLLNSTADAIYLQFVLPRGVDTSHLLIPRLIYSIDASAGTANDADLIFSSLPIEVSNVLVADPSGGTTPTARTVANTSTLTANAGVADSTTGLNINTAADAKLHLIEFAGVDIAGLYEGDIVLFRLELDDDGANNVDVLVWALEVSAVRWTHGEKL